jgi:hypothetical protein
MYFLTHESWKFIQGKGLDKFGKFRLRETGNSLFMNTCTKCA